MSAKQLLPDSAGMQRYAAEVAAELEGGELLLLLGELGAGKTTFTQGLAAALGVAAPVTSPTFTLVSEYSIADHPTLRALVHVDLYRLAEPEASRDPLIAEVIERSSDTDRVTVVEWADRLGARPYSNARTLTFQHEEHGGRSVSLS